MWLINYSKKTIITELILLAVIFLGAFIENQYFMIVFSIIAWIYIFMKFEKPVWNSFLGGVLEWDRPAGKLLMLIMGMGTGVMLSYVVGGYCVMLPFACLYLRYLYRVNKYSDINHMSKKDTRIVVLTGVLAAAIVGSSLWFYIFWPSMR